MGGSGAADQLSGSTTVVQPMGGDAVDGQDSPGAGWRSRGGAPE